MAFALSLLTDGQHLHQMFHSGSHEVEEGFRIQTDPEDEDEQGQDGDDLAPVEVADGMSVFLDFFHDLALDSRHDHAEGGDDGVDIITNGL